MTKTDFEGLYKVKNDIFHSFKHEDEAFITKISDYE